MEGYITLEKVTKVYTQGNYTVEAVKDVSLEIRKGTSVAIVGESGSGKTTLLHMIGNILLPDNGKVIIQGKSYKFASKKERAELRNQFFGYIMQGGALIETESVFENVRLPLLYSKKQVKKIKQQEKVQQLLQEVGVNCPLKFPVKKLSGGQRQRVSICRSLVNGAEVILADEPTGELDSENSQKIFELLKDLTLNGKTFIMVTHNEQLAAQCDRVIRMKDGIVVKESL